MDRGDHRLGRILDQCDQVGQRRAGARLAEFGDVGPGDEGLAAADQDDGANLGVGDGLVDAALDAVAQPRRQRVDRRRIQRQQGDVALSRQLGDIVDFSRGHFSQSHLNRSRTARRRPCRRRRTW